MKQHRNNCAHGKQLRFGVFVLWAPGRCLSRSTQHNLASNRKTGWRDSGNESRPLIAPDLNLCAVTLDVTTCEQREGRQCIRQMTQHRHHLARATAVRFDVGVPRSPARCLVSSAQHNVAINLKTARRDSDTESRPLMAPDFNLCTVILDVTEEKQGEANLLGLHRFHLRRHCWS